MYISTCTIQHLYQGPEGGEQSAPIKFVNDTKLGGQVDTLKDRAVIQKDLSGQKERMNRNLMKLNKDLHLGGKSRFQQYRLGIYWLGCSSMEKELETLVDSKLNISQKHVLAAKAANSI